MTDAGGGRREARMTGTPGSSVPAASRCATPREPGPRLPAEASVTVETRPELHPLAFRPRKTGMMRVSFARRPTRVTR